MEQKYQKLLLEKYQTKSAVATEIINLQAILNLPKATEHFMSDVHGEYDAFQHVLRNGSGVIRRKIVRLFGDHYDDEEIEALLLLIYYPEEQFNKLAEAVSDYPVWCEQTLTDLLLVCRVASRKYTRSKVRKALPSDFAYLIEELLYQADVHEDKASYYQGIFETVLQLKQERALMIDLCYLIQRFVVDHLHIVGDIYDRGPAPDKIMETLLNYHSVDIQWGNHDILWMGAASGVPVCLANVIRICARYNNLAILEDAYGINLLPLINFADQHYGYVADFCPKETSGHSIVELEQVTKLHQAITLIQFKLEGQAIARQQDFHLAHRDMLQRVDWYEQAIQINSTTYDLRSFNFTTVNSEDPNALTAEEAQVMAHLIKAFRESEKLQRHIDFLYRVGGMYRCYNGNLLIHGCVPLTESGELQSFVYKGQKYQGQSLFAFFDTRMRQLRAGIDCENNGDLAWYLWTGVCSPLFGKEQMTTFERYFIEDKTTHHEAKNAYYQLRNEQAICEMLLAEFGLDPATGHIINGHTPVKEKNGESPIKSGGKMLVIDGGFSKPYQKTTGIAGYTLLSNAVGLELVTHQSVISKKRALQQGQDMTSVTRIVDRSRNVLTVSETTIGAEIKEQLADLQRLFAQL